MTNVAVPATTWVGDQDQEYTTGGANNIADATGNLLVDATGVFVVDNGLQEVTLPATTWVEDDSK